MSNYDKWAGRSIVVEWLDVVAALNDGEQAELLRLLCKIDAFLLDQGKLPRTLNDKEEPGADKEIKRLQEENAFLRSKLDNAGIMLPGSTLW